MADKHLAAGVMLNTAGDLLLLHRRKYDQWELPGREVGGELSVAMAAASQGIYEDLDRTVHKARYLGQTIVSQGDVTIMVEFIQATSYVGGSTEILDKSVYDKMDHFNVFRRNGNRHSVFSPVVHGFLEALYAGHISLKGQNPVQ